GRRDARPGVTRPEDVVPGFRSREEAGHAAELPQRVEPLATSGEDLVHVGLVAGVPHELVVRRVEDAMERDRELDRAEAGGDMTPGPLHGLDGAFADLATELEELVPRQ